MRRLLNLFCLLGLASPLMAATGGGGGVSANISYVQGGGSGAQNGLVLSNAAVAATAGRHILIGPGDYRYTTLPDPPPFLKHNVHYYFYPGANFHAGGPSQSFHVFADTAGTPMTSSVTGYGRFYFTNDAGALFYASVSGSYLTFEAQSVNTDGTGTGNAFTHDTGTTMNIRIREYADVANYDFIYGAGTSSKLYLECPRVSCDQDLFEYTGFATWGDCIIKIGWARSGRDGGGSLAKFGSFMDVEVNTWYNGDGGSLQASGTDYAILRNCYLITTNNATAPVIGPNREGVENAHTSFWLKNVVIDFPAQLDPIMVTNVSQAKPLRLENVSFVNLHASSTNIAMVESASFPQIVDIFGSFSMPSFRPFQSNIAVRASSAVPIFSSSTAIANAGDAVTNLSVLHVPAHQLSNTLSLVEANWTGSLNGSATPATNQFQVVFGSQTVLDSGLQNASNGTYSITTTIKSLGPTEQLVSSELFWTGQGLPYLHTNFVTRTVQTNGIKTALRLANTSRVSGSATNRNVTLYTRPL